MMPVWHDQTDIQVKIADSLGGDDNGVLVNKRDNIRMVMLSPTASSGSVGVSTTSGCGVGSGADMTGV